MENKLNELNIFALRDLARRMGVNSPTSKKKEELIKGIVEIISGEKKPEINKTKQGRPPKAFGYDFANVFTANNQINLSKMTFNQAVEEFRDDDIMTVAGWLELVNNNSAILWMNKNLKNENFFVPSEVIKDLDVRMGDRVVAEVCSDETQRVVKKIFSINDCPVNQKIEQRIDFSSIEHDFSQVSIPFNNKKYSNLALNFGENIYVYGGNNNENSTVIADLLNSCKVDNKIYVNISIADKNKMFLSKLENTENFVTMLTEEVDVVRRLVALAIERAKRLLELGQDVVVVVDDMLSIVGIDKENLNLVKKLASVTKKDEKGSITLIAVMPNDSIIQIEKLANKRLKISDGDLLN